MTPIILVVSVLSGITQTKPFARQPEDAAKLQQAAFQSARNGDLTDLKAYFAASLPVNAVNARGDTLLIVAAYNGQSDAVALILKQEKVDVDTRNKAGLTALAAAAFKGEVTIAKKLVDAKADLNAANENGQTILMFAVQAGRTKMVDYLLQAGADAKVKDKSGNSPLSLAKAQGSSDIVKLLEK